MSIYNNFSDYDSFLERAYALKEVLSKELKKEGYEDVIISFGEVNVEGTMKKAVKIAVRSEKGETEDVYLFYEEMLMNPDNDSIFIYAYTVSYIINLRISEKFDRPILIISMLDGEFRVHDSMTKEEKALSQPVFSSHLPLERPIKGVFIKIEDGLFYYSSKTNSYKRITIFDDEI